MVDGLVRRGDWDEVSRGYTAEEAIAEAERCLDCAVCSECDSCVRACPSRRHRLRSDARRPRRSPSAPWSSPPATRSSTPRASCRSATAAIDNVLTQSQLARLLSAAGPTGGRALPALRRRPCPKNVLMLQCVGSRDCTSSGNEHCSAICCLFATLHSSLIKQHYPDDRGDDRLHRPARARQGARGVLPARAVARRALRARPRRRDRRGAGQGACACASRTRSPAARARSSSTWSCSRPASRPPTAPSEIAHVAGLQTAGAGFIKEYHPKLRPVDTQRTGMFVAGTAQGPKNIPDSIAQAKAAAARAISMLSTGFVLTPAQVAASDAAVCIGCGVCETVCPQSAVTLTAGADAALRGRRQHLPRLRHLRRRVPHRGHPARRLQRRRGAGGGDGLMSAAPQASRTRRRPAERRGRRGACGPRGRTAASSPSAAASAPTPPPTRPPTRAPRCRRRCASCWCPAPAGSARCTC